MIVGALLPTGTQTGFTVSDVETVLTDQLYAGSGQPE